MMSFLVVPKCAKQRAMKRPSYRFLAKRWSAVSFVMACGLTLASCNALTSSSNPGGGDGINDAALGVAASPRVTEQEVNLPRGGGRAQVGQPYRIAGQLYTPREEPNYDRVGTASWYGRAFHGRLTANGEIFDMHTLSAAHPTLPLPSYVRVTNLENNHSVVVRVNDRGPFAHDRLIDLSRRAADVLAFRDDGVARVRVQYQGRAPLHGQDVAWLEASAQVNGLPANGNAGEFQLASAPVPPPVAAPNQVAFVSTSEVQTAAPAPTRPSFLQTLFGGPSAQQPATRRPIGAPTLTSPPPATGAPMVLTPPSVSTQAFVPSFSAPQPPASQPALIVVPNAPIPSAAIGFMASPESAANFEAGFVQRNQSVRAQTSRIESAHQSAALNALAAADQLALQSQAVAYLSARQHASHVIVDTTRTEETAVLVQIGIFGDPANVRRIQRDLAALGSILTQPIQSGGRALTQVRLQTAVADDNAQRSLLRELLSRGYTDAYITSATNG